MTKKLENWLRNRNRLALLKIQEDLEFAIERGYIDKSTVETAEMLVEWFIYSSYDAVIRFDIMRLIFAIGTLGVSESMREKHYCCRECLRTYILK